MFKAVWREEGEGWWVWFYVFMLFNVTFNNISAILWWSVLLVEETGVQGENHRLDACQVDKLYHIILHRVHCKATLYLLLKFPVSPLPGGCNPS